jgi:RHS repeat-associated protein
VTTVTKLIKVEIPSPGQTTPYSIQYFYRQGFDALPLQAPGTSFLLERIVYPLGGESLYTYGEWGCGTKKLCVGSNCADLEEWGIGNRACRGVVQRDLKPEGATGPVATSNWQRRWRASRCGENPAMNEGLENRFAFVSADRTHRTSQLWNDPCDEAILGPTNKRLAGRFRYERSYDGADETTLLRTVESGYDMEQGISAPHASADVGNAIPPTFARDITTTYHDDLGSCFGVGTPGAAKTMETHFRLRDDWNNWRLAWEKGDYIKGTAAGPVHQIFYVDYYSPFALPSKLLDRHEIGAYSRAFSEEGSGTANQAGNSAARYEVSYKFEGIDTADAGLGEIKEIKAKDDWVAASTRLDTNPPTITANQSHDATDLVSLIAFDNTANITQANFSGGHADPATGTRKGYQVNYTWLQGRPATMRIQGLPYDSAKITPDRGAIAAVEDPNGLVSGFSYDALGRLTTIDPPGTVEQATRVIYPTLREMRVIRSAGTETTFLNGTDNAQTYASQEFDGIGRTIKRKKAVPGNADGSGQLAVQIVRYDQVGREIFVSEWMTEEEYNNAPKLSAWYEPSWDRNGDGTVGAPQYFVDGIPVKDSRPWGTTTFYGVPSTVIGDEGNPLRATPDGLGRVRRTVRADGSIIDKRYCGPHEEETVRAVRTAVDGATQYSDVTTRYYKDGNNRLVAVDTMPLAAQSGAAIGADALYDYDARGNLIEVNLLRSDAFTTDPFSVWKNGPRPQGQKRTFTYSATGRLIDSFQPEKGNEKNRLYDVWGNLIAWQDQLGLDRGYYFRNVYDGAGRLTKSERRAGTLNGESVTGTGDRNLVQDGFDSGMDGWEEGKLSGTLFQADPTLWGQTAYTLGCMPAPPGQSGGGLYFGSGCSYTAAPVGAQLVRKTVSGVGRDDALSFKYYRSTRESATLGSGNRDRLSVWVSLNANDTASKRIVFSQSEAQAVYPRWIKAPSFRPADWFTETEWAAGTTKTLTLFLVFEKGDTATSGLGSGVMIDDVYLGRKDVETLAEQVWDEAHCALGTGGDACTLFAVETQDRANAQLTTVKSYRDGVLLNTKRQIFKGLNGRPSGVRSQIDWTGTARPEVSTDWSDFAHGMSYTARGVLETLSHPYLVGITEKRDTLFSYSRDLVTAARDVPRDLSFFKPSGIRYDSAGMPTQLVFANDTTQTIVRDAMHRPLSISSSWVSDPIALFQSGTYQYDGAGNIAAIGGQSFAYDASGRLVKAWMLPQASDRLSQQLHKLDYSYDWFGNIKSQQMASEAGGPTPPLGLNFTLSYDSTANESSSSYYGQANTNRIITSGFAYDANGNSLRFRGKYQQPVAAVWTAQNRMRAFIEGDPTLGSAYPNETYQYDSAGYRIVKIDQTGKPMLSLRDESGSTLSEYLVENGLTHPQLDKDYVYLNGQLLIERTVAPGEPAMTTHSTLKTGNAYNFQLTAQTGHASYAVDISAPSGWRRQVSGLHPDSQNVIAINESEFSPDETNFVRVKIESPEPSGYSAPVSLSFDPDVTGSSSNQIRTVSVSRNGTNIVLRWALNQSNGKQTKLYFQRTDTGTTYLLTPQALNASLTSFTLDSQALASPCGVFWGTQFQTGIETGPGPSSDLGSSRPGEQGTQDGCGSPPPPSPAPAMKFVNAYRHLDHLGSLRVTRDDAGAQGARADYYPFGGELGSGVWPAGNESTRRFSNLERDSGAGMDYVMARNAAWSQARFLSTDPVGMNRQRMTDLQQWNMFAYCKNSPLSFVDPDGRTVKPKSIDAVNKIRATLPSELRSKVTLYSDGTLKVSAANTSDKNFNALKALAESKQTVEVGAASSENSGGETLEFEYTSTEEMQAEAVASGMSSSDKNFPNGPQLFLGLTLTPKETATGNIRVVYSDGTGKASTAPEVEIVMTVAHELYGHALLMIQGKKDTHYTPGGPTEAFFDEIQKRTKENYEKR